ncbi:helix-turn-helix domain-containing protein [Pedobacter cryoconitis]|uniref:AraC-like DNA-binding protein n=1 Tax=Pedobacter cryoconitis TaxID=188932 RepID=A0A327S6E3_9SPHI|nr:helix-turn-helix domain-containing protein [Pedobacter cryoconitis]RAJ24646.1 AraC-like DNA-binding protein [Pedobacter cryoconitis]
MNVSQGLLFFFSALGTFNALILGVYFFFFTRKKYLTNYFLGALLFVLSVRVGKSVFLHFNGSLPKIYLQVGLSACFFIGPFLYYFLRSATGQIGTLKRSWTWSLALLFTLIITAGIRFPYQDYPVLWTHYFVWAIYTQWLIYLLSAGFLLKGMFKKLLLKESPMTAPETWLLMIFISNAIIFIFYFLALINAPFTSYISGAVVFSFILYLIISVILYRKKTDDLFLLTPNKPPVKRVNEADAEILIRKLEKIMLENEFYKNPDLKLSDLSKGINISSHQLSQLLNDNLGKNFTTFVNEFRIKEACKIISTDDRLTLESIGYEVGFNSKSTFFAAFKKQTNTTPLNYQQSMLKQ